mmetsp:Transcript_23847/g.32787  ORF Transcript_23847/g.32787 Transcript_23847/m.32787 type:complete len:175 (-) Transcript_23847:313-837(-)
MAISNVNSTNWSLSSQSLRQQPKVELRLQNNLSSASNFIGNHVKNCSSIYFFSRHRNKHCLKSSSFRKLTRCSSLGDDHDESNRAGSKNFMWGFLVGGAVFGTAAFLFAPQLSKRLLSENDRIRLPRFLNEDDDDLETTRRTLNDKIAQLNTAIDEVSAQLEGSDENVPKTSSG